VVGSDVDQRLRVVEEMLREQAARGYGATIIVQDGLPSLPGTSIHMPSGPPVIEQKSNPWGNVPDAGSAVDVMPKKRGRPRKQPKPKAGPEPLGPKGDPESS
jgi:hypothetical protein